MSNDFVDSLESLRDRKDTGAMAKLRRGLGKKSGDVEMYPYVMRFMLEDEKYGLRAERYFLVGSLFALHPDRSPARGDSMGSVFRKTGDSDSTEKRFKALLDANEDDLAYHLRQAVSLAKSKNVAIDYHKLFKDLGNWTHPEKFVQLAWAGDFWGPNQQYSDSDKKEQPSSKEEK